MVQSSRAGVETGSPNAPTCPTCNKPLAPNLACWPCCDRLCPYCGRQTGSAFIEVCWPCWYLMTVKEDKLPAVASVP
jgi:ribosomal protein L32